MVTVYGFVCIFPGTRCLYEDITGAHTNATNYERYKRGYCAYDEYCEGGSLPAAFGTCDHYGINCCKVKYDSKIKPIPKLEQPVMYLKGYNFSTFKFAEEAIIEALV